MAELNPDAGAMIEALRETVPRPELADRLALFGRFVGSWDVERTGHREAGDEIGLSGTTDDGHPVRWILSDIPPDSVRWRSEESADGGATWRTTVTMRMRRKSVAVADAPAGR